MRPVRRYRYEYRQKKKRLALERELEKARRAEEGWRWIVKEALSWVLYAAIIVGLTFLIVNFVVQRTKVSGRSMEATLSNQDNILVDKISYRFREPERFEIIVFEHYYAVSGLNGEKELKYDHYIKRIIGLPGETVQIKGNDIFIDGEKLEENYSRDGVMGQAGIAANPITLGEDEYFVLGDNREHSSDSRMFSRQEIHNGRYDMVTKDVIVGRAWLRIWPFESIGVLKHE